MKKFRAYVMIVSVAVGVFVSAGCDGNCPSTSLGGHPASLKVSLLKSSLAEQVTQVLLRVEVDAELAHEDLVAVRDGEFHFDVFELPAGEAVLLLRALDASGDTLYSADTTVTIAGGAETTVTIELLPAISMTKLSPYFLTVPVTGQFTSTLELFNIERFFAGSFRIVYDPEIIAYDDAVSSADPAWGDLVTFTEDLGDTLVLSVSRTRGNPDSVPPGVSALVDLRFHLLTSTVGTSLKVLINRIEHYDGVIDVSEIYVDYQTIVSDGGPMDRP